LKKVTKLQKALMQVIKKKIVRIGELEKLNSMLMHMTIGIPNGHGLLSPLIALIATKGASCNYKDKTISLNDATKTSPPRLVNTVTNGQPAANTLC